MNTPRLRRGGGIASSSNLVFYPSAMVFLYSIFCLRLSFRVWSDGLYFFWGVSCSNLLLVFSELLVIFRNLFHIFSQVLGLSLGLFYFIFIFMYLILG